MHDNYHDSFLYRRLDPKHFVTPLPDMESIMLRHSTSVSLHHNTFKTYEDKLGPFLKKSVENARQAAKNTALKNNDGLNEFFQDIFEKMLQQTISPNELTNDEYRA